MLLYSFFMLQGKEKKFDRAANIYKGMLEKEKSNASLTEEDKMHLFSGIRTVVMSVDVMFSSACKEPLAQLFAVVNENRSLFPKECDVSPIITHHP